MRKSTAIIAPVLAMVLVLTLAQVVVAKTISDPNESAISNRDIRSVTLARPKARTLAWTLVTWDKWSSKSITVLGLKLYLDVRSTSKADYVIDVRWDPVNERLVCQVERPNGNFVRSGTVSRPSGRSMKCVFSTKGFAPDKAIHWRAVSEAVGGSDKAPNRGWAVGV